LRAEPNHRDLEGSRYISAKQELRNPIVHWTQGDLLSFFWNSFLIGRPFASFPFQKIQDEFPEHKLHNRWRSIFSKSSTENLELQKVIQNIKEQATAKVKAHYYQNINIRQILFPNFENFLDNFEGN
jgi:hypothetical protein